MRKKALLWDFVGWLIAFVVMIIIFVLTLFIAQDNEQIDKFVREESFAIDAQYASLALLQSTPQSFIQSLDTQKVTLSPGELQETFSALQQHSSMRKAIQEHLTNTTMRCRISSLINQHPYFEGYAIYIFEPSRRTSINTMLANIDAFSLTPMPISQSDIGGVAIVEKQRGDLPLCVG